MANYFTFFFFFCNCKVFAILNWRPLETELGEKCSLTELKQDTESRTICADGSFSGECDDDATYS